MQRHSVSVHGERWLLRASSQSLQVRRREGHAARRLTAGRTVKLIPPGLTGRFAAPLAAGMGGGRFPRVVGVSAEATVVELSPAGLSIEVLAGEEPLPHCSKVLPPSLPNANAEGLLLRRPDAPRTPSSFAEKRPCNAGAGGDVGVRTSATPTVLFALGPA